jgi:hypothetical protein
MPRRRRFEPWPWLVPIVESAKSFVVGGAPAMAVAATTAGPQVAAAAAEELRGAQSIIVCGYSLPDTGLFFQHLYAVGTIGEVFLRDFWVFNPDATLEDRFRSFLCQRAEGPFQHFP